MPPLVLVLVIVLSVVIGLVYWAQRIALYRGYRQIAEDVRQTANALNGEVFRDSDDLVIAGRYEKLPVIIRFSDNEERPQFRVQMRAPVPFSLSLLPQNGTSERRSTAVRTGSYLLDSKFTALTSQPTQAKMLFNDKPSLSALTKLCYSRQTEFHITAGEMELIERAVPSPVSARIAESLQSMTAIARLAEQIPGAEHINVGTLPGRRVNWTFRAVLSTGLLVVIFLVWAHPGESGTAAAYEAAPPATIPGVSPIDATQIHRLAGWHVAATEDFPQPEKPLFQNRSWEPAGYMSADFSGRGKVNDHAYLFVDGHGKRRVSLLADSVLAFDQIFDKVAVIAIVPKSKFPGLKWISAPASEPDGDLLLVVQDASNPAANFALFRSGNQTVSGALQDFSAAEVMSQTAQE